jgi:channel protein (hemolysin III family)
VHLPGFHEPFSAISHLLGAVAFLLLGLLLLARGWGDWRRCVWLAIYVGSGVLLLTISAMYHMSRRGSPANELLLRLDHAAIFVLIAGTCTPMHALLFRGWLRWGPLTLIWSVAALGVASRMVRFAEMGAGALIAVYLALGWLGGISGLLLWRRFGKAFVRPLFLGGVAYSIGAMVELFHWPILVPSVIHPHEIFHIAVLVGAMCHWQFVWQFASGYVKPHDAASGRRSRSAV